MKKKKKILPKLIDTTNHVSFNFILNWEYIFLFDYR